MYEKTNWVNDSLPAINAEKLNKIEQGIYEAHDKANINEVNIENLENKIEEQTSYSTTEQIVGKWINGKKIYRKVINFGTLPNTGIKNVSTDLLINEANIVNYYGLAQGQAGNLKYVLHLPDIFVDVPTQSIRLTINTQNNKYNIAIQTGSDRSNYDAFVVIEYTKTTD